MAIGRPHLSTSALRFPNEDLDYDPERSRHDIDVVARDLTTLNVDLAQMGVGGDTSWGARPHPQYTIEPKPYRYSFILRPFDLGEVAVGEGGRLRPEAADALTALAKVRVE